MGLYLYIYQGVWDFPSLFPPEKKKPGIFSRDFFITFLTTSNSHKKVNTKILNGSRNRLITRIARQRWTRRTRR